MELLPKIAVFYACLWVVLWLLKRSPESWLSKAAFSWQGPFPAVGETKSHFLRRQAMHATSWLVQIILVAAIVVILTSVLPTLKSSEAFQIVTAFALTLGAAMAIVSAVFFSLASVKASMIGPNPEFELAKQEEPEDEEATEA